MKTRSYVANFEMRLGPLETTGRLLPVRATEDKVKLCTRDGGKVTQVYIDEQGKVYRNRYELYRGIEVKGESKLTVLGSASKLAEVRTSQLKKNSITFSLHNTRDVLRCVFPSENQGYIFAPALLKNKKVDPHAAKNYEAILAFMQDPEITLLGKCNLAGHEGLFKAGLYRDHLYIQKHLYPEDLNDLELEETKVPAKVAEATSMVARKMVETFDPAHYDNTIARRIALLAEGGEDAKVDITADIIESLMSMFEVDA